MQETLWVSYIHFISKCFSWQNGFKEFLILCDNITIIENIDRLA